MSKYYRLLKDGEIIQQGDCKAFTECLAERESHIGEQFRSGYIQPTYRPVHVDEWHDYAKEKPTKEDFEPTGYIQIKQDYGEYLQVKQDYSFFNTTHWRRVTPPEPSKPKSKEVFPSWA